MKKLDKILFLAVALLIWQGVCVLGLFPEILFPSPVTVGKALINSFAHENMLQVLLYSMSLICRGLVLGCGLGILLSMLSITFQWVGNIYGMVISVMDPLPGIAILPLAILWFGTGEKTIVFIIVHSVIWPISRNVIDGFSSVSPIYVESGLNMGLSRLQMVSGVYLPAAFPYLLSGLKVGWARAWRALISAEMIFGVSGSIGGLGWYIFKKRYQLETDGVFAALIVIILIGLIVEYGIFAQIEKRTVKKWGMMR